MSPTGPAVDLDRLNRWPGLADLPGDGRVEDLTRLKGGAQNLLFVMRRADGTELVLRRPGRYSGDGSATSLPRENRVLTALTGTDVPRPRLYATCMDDSVIGAPFSVMERIDGFMPRGDLPGRYATDRAWRRAVSFDLVASAAGLAAVDPDAVGLTGLSRTEDWAERQTPRYLRMLEGYRENAEYRENESTAVDEVGEWLRANPPTATRIGIVHGDFQFANVMYAHDAPRVAGIVDWEMASLGDPLLDLAWILTAWREEGDPPGGDPQMRPWEDMPTRAELVAHYAALTGRDVSGFAWFQVLACFRLASLLEGSYFRALNGGMDRRMGEGLHAYAGWIWSLAVQLVRRA
ncbi:phosphotransferase family protein [Actinocorallia aurantiaca]|uniref:Phosphotransferase family protein n=1 Tax=Actinocorallia aurantiaca TaxID=46204 RepID=A0ABN3UI55_9ACTN